MQLILLSILALAAPFLLWFPERVFQAPYVLEEAAKLFLVSFFPQEFKLSKRIILAVCLGGLFSLSELILYSFNINYFGYNLFFKRMILVGIMHMFTFTIIAVSGHKTKYGLIIGFLLACLIHYFFNWVLLLFLQNKI